MEYLHVILKDDNDYICTCREMPSISGIGDTIPEAIEEFTMVMSLVKEIMKEQGTEMPSPIQPKETHERTKPTSISIPED